MREQPLRRAAQAPALSLPRAAAVAAPLLLPLLLLLLGSAVPPCLACTSMIVGNRASADGSTIIARNGDPAEVLQFASNLHYHPPREGPALYTDASPSSNLSVELPAPGLAYTSLALSIPPPGAEWNASTEEAGVNSAGVALSAVEALSNSAAALADDPYTNGTGLGISNIPSIILPHPNATSAREAMALLGSYIQSLGASQGFGVQIADGEEAWYIETGSGHHWLAHRLPADTFFVTANQGRLQEVDLQDEANVMASPGLLEYAVSHGLYNPGSGQPFNFQKAFMRDDPAIDPRINYHRVCQLQRLFAGSSAGPVAIGAAGEEEAAAAGAGPACGPQRPAFMKPERKLGVRDVFAGLRDQYEGTIHDIYNNPDHPVQKEEPWRPVALLRTIFGHVTSVRNASAGLPDGLSAVNWVAHGMPRLSVFVPVYKGLPFNAYPPQLTTNNATGPDPVSLYWRARRLQALVFQDWAALAQNATAAILEFEADVEQRQAPDMEGRYMAALEAGNERAATAELVAFTASVAWQAGDLLAQLTEQAAATLGLPGVPADDVIQAMLQTAAKSSEPWFGWKPS